ncbi:MULTISPECIES: Cas10/Cmr2 second palm domain-containing protein [unclassified Microcoleus]|uniref:Cas10/Cmr2 second palm domain-containing protein n=1 Tax=unclassified Microcoleus TaxID=2642155 RepID=UPI002FD014D3
MSNYIATVIDTTGIQKYVFGSNRLKENIGASHLVKLATVQWVKDCLICLDNNVHIPDEDKEEVEPCINTDESIVAELVYAGGGNTVLLFRSMEFARKFTQNITRKILEDAPGLNIVIAHHPFNWDTQLLQQVIENDLIKGKLDAQKRQPIPSVPLMGLSVTATCRSTGLVAVEDTNGKYGIPDGEGYLASREIIAKLKAADEANTQFKEMLFKGKPSKYKVARDVDDMGRTEQESSYIALVHADGNQMGNRFDNYGKSQRLNRDFIVKMRRLSWGVSKAASSAIEEVGKLVIDAIETGKISIKENYLPFRPIVYGGDDVTFVCDGRIGLPLAVKFLKEFEARTQNLPDGKGKATACAGIAIVKTHYPFARTYELCEALCSRTKKFVRQETDNYSKRKLIFSALDWHIAASGLSGSIGEIREREYQGGKLITRPMRSHEYGDDWLTWTDFAEVVRIFNEEEPWKGKRNKVITLREVLREGQTATKQFLNTYGIDELPAFPKAKDNSILRKQGWDRGRCRYFDAIEAMEFYIPLGE